MMIRNSPVEPSQFASGQLASGQFATGQIASKLAAVALLLAVIATVHVMLIMPFGQMLQATADKIAEERAFAARFTASAAAIRRRQAGLVAAGGDGAATGNPAGDLAPNPLSERRRLLIEADSDTVVTARAQAHVRAIVDAIGPTVNGPNFNGPNNNSLGGQAAMRLLSARTTGIKAASATGGSASLRAVGLELQLTVKWQHIPPLLNALATAEPIIVTQAVQIVPSARRSIEPDADATAETYDLRLELAVFTAGQAEPDTLSPIRASAEHKEAGVDPLPRR